MKKALAALSPTLQISRLYDLNHKNLITINQKQTHYKIKKAKFHDGRIYLLLTTWEKNAAVGEFDLTTNKLNILSAWTSKPEGKRNDIQAWTTDGKYAAVCNRTSIRILKLDGSKECIIRDLPAESVMSTTIMDDRIYTFIGRHYYSIRRGRPAETILFSCQLDGNDRKVHMSTLNEKKRYEIENKPFTVNAMIADPFRKRLVFVSKPGFSGPRSWGEPYQGLFEYYIDSGKLDKLINCEIRGFSIVGNQIFMKCNFGRKKRAKFLLYDINSEKKISAFELSGSAKFSPFYVYGCDYAQQGQLWFYNGSFIDYISGPDSKRYPVLLSKYSSP